MNENPSLQTIFEEAVEIADLSARVAYLDRACGEDKELRREVDSLLAAHFAACEFMENATASLNHENPDRHVLPACR